MTKIQVQFTADVGTEESAEHGDAAFRGWVDPTWSKTELRELPTDVKTFTFTTQAEAEAFVDSEIGSADSFDGEHWYAADPHVDNDNGETWNYCAHFTEVKREAGDFRSYRGKMLAGVGLGDGPDDDNFYRMKVTGKAGDTKWFNISPDELEKIIAVLEPEDYAAATEGIEGVVL